MATSLPWERMIRSTLTGKRGKVARLLAQNARTADRVPPNAERGHAGRQRLPVLLLVTVLAQALLPLVGGHLMSLPFLTAGHMCSVLVLVLDIGDEPVGPVDQGGIGH